MRNFVFIGSTFYTKSNTIMSSVYEVKSDGKFARSDWGWIEVALENGEEVLIRPATNDEMKYFYDLLMEYV